MLGTVESNYNQWNLYHNNATKSDIVIEVEDWLDTVTGNSGAESEHASTMEVNRKVVGIFQYIFIYLIISYRSCEDTEPSIIHPMLYRQG